MSIISTKMFQLYSMNCANNQQKQRKTIILKFLDNFQAIMSKTEAMLYIFGKQTSDSNKKCDEMNISSR